MTYLTPRISTSLFLIGVGAILRYAVTVALSGVVLTTVGLILMIVGGVGLVISLAYVALNSTGRPTTIRADPSEEPIRRDDAR
jgi:hypothetical protein